MPEVRRQGCEHRVRHALQRAIRAGRARRGCTRRLHNKRHHARVGMHQVRHNILQAIAQRNTPRRMA